MCGYYGLTLTLGGQRPLIRPEKGKTKTRTDSSTLDQHQNGHVKKIDGCGRVNFTRTPRCGLLIVYFIEVSLLVLQHNDKNKMKIVFRSKDFLITKAETKERVLNTDKTLCLS